MARSLVIVESPAKAKTIKKFLGKGFDVESSMGHVRDLPERKFGIDIENDFTPTYEVIAQRKTLVRKLAAKAKESDAVYLAPDPDREGEAIAWHLAQALKLSPKKTFRVTFNEITKRAISEAFQQPRQINDDKVNAQQTRRILDRIVGYELSPLLWKKIARGLSAGRVQSVAVKLIVEREREIAAFVTEEYWKITATLSPADGSQAEIIFSAELRELNGEKFKAGNEQDAKRFLPALQEADYTVAGTRKRIHKSSPSAPFNTSTLQQQAANELGFSAARTMLVAQQLYEGLEVGSEGPVGLITYMRTDSFRIADEAMAECRDFIGKEFGANYLSDKPRVYASRKGAQEAHEAVRPTSVLRTPESLEQYLGRDQYKLYDLVWRRFVATQMAQAEYEITEVEIRAAERGALAPGAQPVEGMFFARGRVILFDGHTKVSGQRKADEQNLPAVKQHDPLKLHKLEPTQHFTKPPARYTEASLVKTLEREGIGRPSTYATIISTIQGRGYVEQREKKFHATELGILVTDKLVEHFADVVDTKFTSRMEEKLDKIEDAHADHLVVLREFYSAFSTDMEKARGAMQKVVEQTEHKCDKCGEPMVIRMSRKGRFLACSGFPKCKNTMPLGEDNKPAEPEPTDEKCAKCGAPMVIKTGSRGRFLACSAYPECKNTASLENGQSTIEPTDEKCAKCGAPMVIRTGRRGKFAACSAFPKCRNTKPIDAEGKIAEAPKVEEKCEKCGSAMVLRSGRRGRFLACSAYPKCKNTKALPAEAKQPPVPTDIACEKCGKPMLIRTSVRGRFLGCSGYPKCRNTAQLPPELEEAKAAGEEAKITGEAKTEEEKAAPEVVG